MAHMSVPCHEGPPATKGHFSSEPAVAGGGRYYCSADSNISPDHTGVDFERVLARCRSQAGVDLKQIFW